MLHPNPQRVLSLHRQAAELTFDESTARLVVSTQGSSFRVYLRMERESDRNAVDVGWIMLREVGQHLPLNTESAENVSSLTDLYFGGVEPKVWHVLQSDLLPPLQGKRWGMALYLKALDHIRPAIVVADAARSSGGETKPQAALIWTRLALRFPHIGNSPKNLALALL